MDSTPRFRLFDSRRGDIDREEEEAAVAARAMPRRRMLTSVSVARARRRNRRRPGASRGGGLSLLSTLLLSLPGAMGRRRRAFVLLLLAVCGAGGYMSSARLLASWLASSSPTRPGVTAGGAPTSSGGDGYDVGAPRGGGGHNPAVSLGPDAIPSVLLVERRPGGARGANGLDVGGAAPAAGVAVGEGQAGLYGCQNTAQGAVLLADSEGRVCRRTEVDDIHRPGCCAAAATAARPPPPPLPGEAAASDAQARALGEARAAQSGPEWEGLGGEAEAVGAAELMGLPPGVAGTVGRSGGLRNSDGFPPEQALATPFSCWSCDEGGQGGGGGGGGGGYSSCCRSYEFCVSCCQAPWRELEREAIRAASAHSGHPVYRELGLGNNNGGGGEESWPRRQLLRGRTGVGNASASSSGLTALEEEKANQRTRDAREAAFAHCAFRCRTYSGSVAHENAYRSPLKHCFGRFRPPVSGAPNTPSAGAAVAGGGHEVVGSGGGQDPGRLQLDPFLAGLAVPES